MLRRSATVIPVLADLPEPLRREYYFGPEDQARHHGPENYNGWWTLGRFPGWRCTEGRGGGYRKRGHEALLRTL
jgi:hypothetical protein